MASGTGPAALVVTALVAGLVAFGVAALAPSSAPPPPEVPGTPGPPGVEALRGEIRTLRAELAELRSSRAGSPAGTSAPGSPAAAATAHPAVGAPSESTAEAPLPKTRAELEALVDARIAARGAAGLPGGPEKPVRKQVTLDEAGTEMGLSASEIDAVKRIWKDAENEMLVSVMGTSDMEAIKEEVLAAKDDPDRKAALVTKAMGNLFKNLGRIMTIEDRRDRELKKFLPEDQVKKLKGYDVKSTLDDSELGTVLEDVFDR